MNILEALNVALPELPARTAKLIYPKLDPRVIAREHVEQGAPTTLVHLPGGEGYVRITPDQWKLLQLFDGQRSYAEVSQAFLEQTGVLYSENDVRDFATILADATDVFYKSPAEKNIILRQKLSTERHKKRRRAFDPAEIPILEWDPDVYLTKLYSKMSFVYTRWFTLLTLACFLLLAYMWSDKFSEIWSDSFEYYNFTEKGFRDLVEFWFLFGAMAFFHESAHGLTCKHFGGGVRKMGFILMYFGPTFYCDTTQVWIYGGRFARLATVIAGIWIDLVLCFFATVVWWGTATGMAIHDFAYKVMMITGIGVTVLNLNPLIKLDGYYMFSELIGEPDLKERSTAYVSSWVRNKILRLPVEIEYVPKPRRRLYLIYAFLSGVYSYSLLIVVLLFAHHVFRKYSSEWAFVPSLYLAYLMFKSKIWNLVRLMNTVYLDKKERLRAWLTPPRIAAISAVTVLVLFAPLWPQFVEGKFALEAARRAIIRAEVAGMVGTVSVDEGQAVEPGATVAGLRNLVLESQASRARADLQVATARATQSQLQFVGFGPAERERQQAAERNRALAEQLAKLQVTSPIAGVVVTPRPRDLTGSYVEAGMPIVEIADPSSMVARIFVPEFDIRDVRLGAPAELRPEAFFGRFPGTLRSIAPASSELEPGMYEKATLKGIYAPHYYVASVLVDNNGLLKEGLTGTAKIFVRRRSLAAIAWQFTRDLVQRRLW